MRLRRAGLLRVTAAQVPGLLLLGVVAMGLAQVWGELRGAAEDGRRHWPLWQQGWVIREPGWVDGMAWLLGSVPPDEALAVADFGDPARAAARAATRMKTAYVRLPEPVLSLSDAGWAEADWVLARWDLQGVMLRDRVFHDFRLVSGGGLVRLYQRQPADGHPVAGTDLDATAEVGAAVVAPGSPDYWRMIGWQAVRMGLLLLLLLVWSVQQTAPYDWNQEWVSQPLRGSGTTGMRPFHQWLRCSSVIGAHQLLPRALPLEKMPHLIRHILLDGPH